MVNEKLEKHETLNQKLFDGDQIKPEVRDKVEEVTNEFLKILAEDAVTLKVRDVILTGSNASYNYNDKSDIDVHILADTASLNDPDKLYTKLYNAYRRLFESKFDITFYGIPVEVYVETEDNPVVSNGIYSIMFNKWRKYPEPTYVPDIDQKVIDKAAEPWFERAKKILRETDNNSVEREEEITKFFTDLYELRHKGIYATSGSEFSEENLVFKEIRNSGLLEKLKELKNDLIASRLSLGEAYLDAEQTVWDYKTPEIADGDYIDTSKASCFSAADLLKNPEQDNLVSEIMYMTPDQYFELCSKIQHVSPEDLKNDIGTDDYRLEKVKDIITKYKRKFPMPYICFAKDSEIYGQEGRHRLYALGELFGWDKEYPVQVIQNKDEYKPLDKLIQSSIIESFVLPERERRDYQIKIAQLTHQQPIVQSNGVFQLYNVKEDDARFIISILRRQPWIEYAELSAERYDFSKMVYSGLPSRLYTINGKIRIN